MQVNTDFWGSPETWATPSVTQAQNAEIKLINWTGSRTPTMWEGGYNATGDSYYVTGDPPKPEKTPVAWGIGINSAICKPRYGFLGYTMTDSQTYASPMWYTRNIRFDESKPFDFCPQYGNYGVSQRSCGWGRRVSPSVSSISSSATAAGGILSFNYQNIVVYPTLEIAKSVTPSASFPYGIQKFNSGSIPVSIDEYFSGGTSRFPNPAKDEYPYILAVKIGKWLLGGQPIYSGDTYVSGERNEITRNYISGRFNEQCKGREYAIGTELKYANSTSTRHPKMQNDFYTLYPVTLYDSTLSGYCYNSEGFLVGLQPNTALDDEQKAWIMADASDGNYPVFCNNGKYEYRAIQSYYGDTYRNQAIITALWENATKDEVLRDVAFLGFWFSEDETTARRALTGENCNDSKMHIPVFDSKGVTTGEWKSGTDAANEPNAKWNDPFNDSPYNPQGGGDDDDFGDLENTHMQNRIPTTLNIYLMNGETYENFVQAVNGIYASDPQGVTQWTLDFNGANPSDYIVASYATLLDLPVQNETIHPRLGNISTPFSNIDVYQLGDNTGIFDCGSVQFNAYYNDFRDYAPYTTAQIYIPLCGTVDIEPEFFVGHSVNVVYFYDVLTMSLAAGIYRDAYTLYKVVNGSAGAEIPLTSMRMGDYQNAIHNIEQSLKRSDFNIAMSTFTSGASLVGAVASGGASVATGAGIVGGGGGLISNLMAKQDLQYQMQHTVPKPSGTTAAEAQNGFCVGSLYPILFIKRAKMQNGYDADIYSHTVGNACLMQSKIKDMSGLIKCSNVDLSGIPATAEEINAIQTALQNGVYV